MDFVHSGKDRGNELGGQFVDELAEDGVFLGRAAHGGEGPDSAVAVVYRVDVQHGEIVFQAVVSQVVAKGTFGQFVPGQDMAADAEIRLCQYGQLAGVGDHVHAVAAQNTCEIEFGHAFGQGHDRGQGHGGRAADEDIDFERLLAGQGLGVMRPYAAVDLVVQARFLVLGIPVAGNLHPVHAQIGSGKAGFCRAFGIDLGQGDVGSSIHGQLTSWGRSESVVRLARTGPDWTLRGRACSKARGVAAYFQGALRMRMGSALRAMIFSTARRVDRKM